MQHSQTGQLQGQPVEGRLKQADSQALFRVDVPIAAKKSLRFRLSSNPLRPGNLVGVQLSELYQTFGDGKG